MEVVVGVSGRERHEVEGSATALREVHRQGNAALQGAQSTKLIEVALVAPGGHAVVANCLVSRFNLVVLRTYAVRRPRRLPLGLLRWLHIEVAAPRALDVAAVLVADSLALGRAPASAIC